MAGDWLKIEMCLHEKPEVMAIAAHMNMSEDEVVGKLIRVWRWFNQHTTDGCNALVTQVKRIDSIAGVSGFADAMQKVGWLTIGEAGASIPHFDRHNSKAAKTRALTKERVSAHRNAGSVTDALPEKRREEKSNTPPTPQGGGAGGDASREGEEPDSLAARMGTKHANGHSNATLLAHWNAVHTDKTVRVPASVLRRRLQGDEPAPPLTPEAVRNAIHAGIVRSINGQAVTKDSFGFNSGGVYVNKRFITSDIQGAAYA